MQFAVSVASAHRRAPTAEETFTGGNERGVAKDVDGGLLIVSEWVRFGAWSFGCSRGRVLPVSDDLVPDDGGWWHRCLPQRAPRHPRCLRQFGSAPFLNGSMVQAEEVTVRIRTGPHADAVSITTRRACSPSGRRTHRPWDEPNRPGRPRRSLRGGQEGRRAAEGPCGNKHRDYSRRGRKRRHYEWRARFPTAMVPPGDPAATASWLR